jgi:hypothetical protein
MLAASTTRRKMRKLVKVLSGVKAKVNCCRSTRRQNSAIVRRRSRNAFAKIRRSRVDGVGRRPRRDAPRLRTLIVEATMNL